MNATSSPQKHDCPFCSCPVTRAEKPPTLTPRESEVFRLLAGAHSNGQIATNLNLSEKTVKNVVSRVFDKLGVHSRAQVVAAFYLQYGGKF